MTGDWAARIFPTSAMMGFAAVEPATNTGLGRLVQSAAAADPAAIASAVGPSTARAVREYLDRTRAQSA